MSGQEQVARALVNKGFNLGELGRNEETIAVCDDLLARFGAATELARTGRLGEVCWRSFA